MKKILMILLLAFSFLAVFSGVEAVTWSTGDWNSQITDVNHMSGDANQMAIVQRSDGSVWVCNKVGGGTTCEEISTSAFLTPQNIVAVYVKHYANTIVYVLIDSDEGVATGNTELPLQPGGLLAAVPQITGGGPYQGGGISITDVSGSKYAGLYYIDGDSAMYWEALGVDWGTPGSGGPPEFHWEPDPPPNPPEPADVDGPWPQVSATPSALLPFTGATADLTYYSSGWQRVDTSVEGDVTYCVTYYNGHDYALAIGDDGAGNVVAQSFVDFALKDTETVVASDKVASDCAFNQEIFGAGYATMMNPADSKTELYPFTITTDGDISFGSADTFNNVNCNDVLPEVYYSSEHDEFVLNLGDDTSGCSAYYGEKTDASINISWNTGNVPYLAITATDNDCAPCLTGSWSGSCTDPLGHASVIMKNDAGETSSFTLQVPCVEDVDLTAITLLGGDVDQKIGIDSAVPNGVVIPDHTIVVPDTGATPYFVFGSTSTLNDIAIDATNAKVGLGSQQYTYNGVTYNATITDEGSYFQMIHVVGSGGGEGQEAVPEFPMYGLVMVVVVVVLASYFILRRKKK